MLRLFGRALAYRAVNKGIDQVTKPQKVDRSKPPKNAHDPRIEEVKRKNFTNCWIWQPERNAKNMQEQIWQSRKSNKGKSPEIIFTLCGEPKCVRGMHVASGNSDVIRVIESSRNRYRNGVPLSKLASDRRLVGRIMGWGEDEWSMVFDVPKKEFRR